MGEPQIELLEHTRFGFRIKEPKRALIGTCECCGESLEVGYEYISWSNMYFSDRGHLIQYLKMTDDLMEVI